MFYYVFSHLYNDWIVAVEYSVKVYIAINLYEMKLESV